MECYDFSRLDPETLVTCPFDEVHRVSVKRLVRHLIKCSKVRWVGTRWRVTSEARPRVQATKHYSGRTSWLYGRLEGGGGGRWGGVREHRWVWEKSVRWVDLGDG